MPKKPVMLLLPVMLLFHPGSFVADLDPGMVRARAAAKQRGFKPRVVDYALSNVPAAMKQSNRLAKRLEAKGRSVSAYGDSAGGAIALALAQRGRVRSAAANSPVTSIPKFLKGIHNAGGDAEGLAKHLHLANPAKQKKFSVAKGRPSRSPSLAFAPHDDMLSLPTLKWGQKDKRVKVRETPGGHLDGATYDSSLNQAMKYLSLNPPFHPAPAPDLGHRPLAATPRPGGAAAFPLSPTATSGVGRARFSPSRDRPGG